MEWFIGIIIVLALAFAIDAGIVWLLCWSLNGIGVHTIGGWTVQFSWPLVVLFIVVTIIITGILRSIFGNKK